MEVNRRLEHIKIYLLKKDLTVINDDTKQYLNKISLKYLTKMDLSNIEVSNLKLILEISNILYNNSNLDMLPLDDGVYDLLLELYRTYNSNIPIGAENIQFDSSEQIIESEIQCPFSIMKTNGMLYTKEILGTSYPSQILTKPFEYDNDATVLSKRLLNTHHNYPKLVGTLDKCKFTLNEQAREKGVVDDPTVKIFERDFINKHINNGIIDPNNIKLVAMLKYDGISVEADVSNRVLSARTRGKDSNAADLTPILYNYAFPEALKYVPDKDIFGMKFEAIITYEDLIEFNRRRDDKISNYKNARTAIIGLFGSGNANSYKDLITLVPLATSLDIDKITEIEFMNKYYSTKESLRSTVIEGNYINVLFQVKRFVEEAEYMRDFMPFMYDGVVISYTDEKVINKLGRKNNVDQFSIAIKFNPMKKNTIFRGYSYTVGQDGSITPMIHYDPVEFYGTVHTKSSGHSYNRFKELNLRLGDMLDIEYVNDVMPYVNKPDNSYNAKNKNEVIKFIKRCPICNTVLVSSVSGKSMICSNYNCEGRKLARMVNMMSKLNLKDFGEANLKEINQYSLNDLLNITMDDLDKTNLGPLMKTKLLERINDIKYKEIKDYEIIGSIGFTNIGRRNWKIILNKISIEDIINLSDDNLKNLLVNIKGIGSSKADTIIEERVYFKDDLNTISKMNNVIRSLGQQSGKSVRFTGVRNKKLIDTLNNLGFDATDGSVTKTTDILIVPYDGFTSSKTKKVSNKCIIVAIDDIINHPHDYI